MKCKKGLYICTQITTTLSSKLKKMETTLSNNWNKLTRTEKIEIIENAIDMCNTNEGFLMLRLWSKDNSITAYVTTKLDNHLCSEAVSQSTLFEMFGTDYDFNEEDAETILTWMETQN